MPSKISNRQWMPQIIDSYFTRLANETTLSIKENLAYEIVWLLRNFRIPISGYQQEFLESLVLNTQNYTPNIVNIILFLIREYRLDGVNDFLKYTKLLASKPLNCNQSNELSYQKILWYQDSLSDNQLKEKIDSWSNDEQSLDFLIKKACILFSISEFDEALTMLRNVLQTARQLQSISTNNFFARSVEGVVLTLLQKYENKPSTKNYFNRLIELDQSFCSPSTTIEYISNFKREKIPDPIEYTTNFDGKEIISHHMGSYGTSDFTDAFFLMSLYDDYKIGIDKSHRIDILKYLFINYPKYSLKKVFYLTKEKELDIFFSKEQVYDFKEDQINSLYDFLINTLEGKSIKSTSMILDVLFRLYTVLNDDQRNNLEKILLRSYSSADLWGSLGTNAHKTFNICFSRVLQTKYGKDLDLYVNKLFNLPMLSEKKTSLENIKRDEHYIFDPLQIINQSETDILNIHINSSHYTLNRLLSYLKDESLPFSVRLSSWIRFMILQKSRNIPFDDYPKIKALIKSMILNDDKIFQSYLKSYAITNIICDKNLASTYFTSILSKKIPENLSSSGLAYGTRLETIFLEIRNLLLTETYDPSIYSKLVERIGNWWDSQYLLAKNAESDSSFFRTTDLNQMIYFIKDVIFKRVKKKFFTAQMKQTLTKCYSDLKQDDDKRALLLLPGILKLSNNSSINLLQLFKDNILSANKTNIKNAAYLIQDVAFYKDRNELELNIRELKIILLQLFAVQKESSLPAVSQTISLILENSKKFFTEKEKKTLGANIDQFFSSYLSIDAQTVFKQDVFNEILINYLDIITELRSEHINIKLDQWIYFCSHMKYPEISRYTSILKEK